MIAIYCLVFVFSLTVEGTQYPCPPFHLYPLVAARCEHESHSVNLQTKTHIKKLLLKRMSREYDALQSDSIVVLQTLAHSAILARHAIRSYTFIYAPIQEQFLDKMIGLITNHDVLIEMYNRALLHEDYIAIIDLSVQMSRTHRIDSIADLLHILQL